MSFCRLQQMGMCFLFLARGGAPPKWVDITHHLNLMSTGAGPTTQSSPSPLALRQAPNKSVFFFVFFVLFFPDKMAHVAQRVFGATKEHDSPSGAQGPFFARSWAPLARRSLASSCRCRSDRPSREQLQHSSQGYVKGP